MGRKVLVCFKIMPKSPECDLVNIQKDIKEKHEKLIENFKIEDIAFGLKMLKALYILEDKSGIVDQIQGELANIENIKSIDVENITLV